MANAKTSIRENMRYNSGRWYRKFSLAPMELKVFAIFAAAISILQMVVFFTLPNELFSWYAKNLRTLTGSNYMFVLIVLISLMYTPNINRRNRLRFGIVGILCIGILFNGILFLNEGSYNYLAIIFTIVIPVCWILLMLFSPAINRFCKNIAQQ